MRMRPASLTAAAPPSSCHDTHSVAVMASSVRIRKGVATKASFMPRFHCRVLLMAAS